MHRCGYGREFWWVVSGAKKSRVLYSDPTFLIPDLWRDLRNRALAGLEVDPRLGPAFPAVFSALADFRNVETGQCNPSLERLQRVSCVGNEVTLRRYLTMLEDRDFITIHRGEYDKIAKRQSTNWYELHPERGHWTVDYPKRTNLPPRPDWTAIRTFRSMKAECLDQQRSTPVDFEGGGGGSSSIHDSQFAEVFDAPVGVDHPCPTPIESLGERSNPDPPQIFSIYFHHHYTKSGSAETSLVDTSSLEATDDPGTEASFWGDGLDIAPSSPSIADVDAWMSRVGSVDHLDNVDAFTEDQRKTIAYAHVQDEVFWIQRHKNRTWRLRFTGAVPGANWITPHGSPYPRRFPLQAVHFEIAERMGLSILEQLVKLRAWSPHGKTPLGLQTSWARTFAKHLLTHPHVEAYERMERTDVEARREVDVKSTRRLVEQRREVVVAYVRPNDPGRWPEYALVGRSDMDPWTARAYERGNDVQGPSCGSNEAG